MEGAIHRCTDRVDGGGQIQRERYRQTKGGRETGTDKQREGGREGDRHRQTEGGRQVQTDRCVC